MNIKIGIIGQGSFGKFLAQKLSEKLQVVTYDRDEPDEKLHEVVTCDYLVLAVPLQSYDEVLQKITPILPDTTTIIDVCSVKQKPVEIIRQYLPSQPIVATHPLFGPESAADSIIGHTLVMCPDVSDPVQYQRISALAQMLGLRVIRMSAEAHDRDMAVVQGLTFFVAHAVSTMKLSTQLVTPSYQKLLALAELDQHHSAELLDTIQKGNSHAKEVREQFIAQLRTLDDEYSS